MKNLKSLYLIDSVVGSIYAMYCIHSFITIYKGCNNNSSQNINNMQEKVKRATLF